MSSQSRKNLRSIAFYLPQFHPIPENDQWWGEGFTEWTSVSRARPLFRGHQQPNLPADLGFYDLRVPEVMRQQTRLAAEYGIYGFCFYHYWFNGRRILERPLDQYLSDASTDFPFMLCWANENWTRVWSGGDQDVLLRQNYSEVDDAEHMRFLTSIFRDPRYIRIHERPVFLVYRVSRLPDAQRTATIWRTVAAECGLDLYLCTVESFGEHVNPQSIGFDAAVEFQPQRMWLGPRVGMGLAQRLLRRVLAPRSAYRKNLVYRYENLVELAIQRDMPPCAIYRCVVPGWDNSPRRQRWARIVHGSTPELYGRWVAEVAQRYEPPSAEENFLFVNAWNEWAEGAYVEPDQRWGRAYLEAHREALLRAGVLDPAYRGSSS